MTSPVALVTGANRGIGRAIARELARRGATVIVTARSLEAAAGTENDVGASAALALDVTDPASVAVAAQDVRVRFGHLDV